jgi:hypothetical protein
MIRLTPGQRRVLWRVLAHVPDDEGLLIEQREADQDRVGPLTITTDSRDQEWTVGPRGGLK